MSDALRDEISLLARHLAAHIEWQRELGVVGFEHTAIDRAGTRAPSPSVAQPAIAPRPAATASAPPALRIERPEFMQRSPARPPAAPLVTPPTAQPPHAPTLFAEPPPPAPSPAAPLLTGADRLRALDVIREQVNACTRCRLHEQRNRTVFSRGSPFAPLAFVGEGPGRDEDAQGLPFVGAAGQLLDKIITAMGLTEDDVYICNVVKCRPPNNRVPQPDEMATCGPYLSEQLATVRPQVMVALGKTAASYLLGTTDAMRKLRNDWYEWRGLPLRVTWHPAYLLRQPEAKKDTWEDMKVVLERLGRPLPGRRV
jgi:DNA polymerase